MSRSHTHIFYLLIGLCFSVNIQGQILDRHLSDLYADKFNQQDKEIYIQSISNKQAKDFLAENIPFFECPDKDIEEIYYFRWWTYRKHIKETPEGFIINDSHEISVFFYIDSFCWMYIEQKSCNDTTS
ncbi:hypothetical protein ABHC69_12785 [Parabacteroides distasonis]|uniref:hypothetical protein n=1 Tax=Parabacteroides distasonis TaxID=823 RepID=UPI00325BA3F9